MQAAPLQKKEPDKRSELAASPQQEKPAGVEEEHTSEAGMPLFLQRFAASSSLPSIRRESVDREGDPLIQNISEDPEVQPPSEDEEKEGPVDFSPKLIVGPPNDDKEKEADRVAKNILSKPGHIVKVAGDQGTDEDMIRTKSSSAPYIQRNIEDDEDEDTQGAAARGSASPVRAKSSMAGIPKATSQVAEIIRFPGDGSSLPRHVKSRVESHVGADLEHVKVHNDSKANQAAKSIHAKAFTHQNHIFLGTGQKTDDLSLMAHEATHVAQQTGPLKTKGAASVPHAQRSRAGVVQRYSLGEFWEDTGGALVSKVKSGVGTVYSYGKKGIKAIGRIAKTGFVFLVRQVCEPLADMIEMGPVSWLEEKITIGLKGWLGGVFGGIAGLAQNVREQFALFAKGFSEVNKPQEGESLPCAFFRVALGVLTRILHVVINNPVTRFLNAVFGKIASAFKKIMEFVLAPVFDAVSNVLGKAWSFVKDIASTVWGWIKKVYNLGKRAVNWVLKKLGLSSGEQSGESGLVSWIVRKAKSIWKKIQGFFRPVIEPIKKVAKVLLVANPIGLIFLLIKYGPKVIDAIRWFWTHRNDRDIVKKAKAAGYTFFPKLITAVKSFKNLFVAAIEQIFGFVSSVAKHMVGFVELISAIPLLDILGKVLSAVKTWFQDMAEKLKEFAQAAVKGVKWLVASIYEFIKPYQEILCSLAIAVVNPIMIPVMLAGWIWRKLPNCVKEPIIDFLLDVLIAVLRRLPSLPMFGALWDIIKTAFIGLFQGFKNEKMDRKISATDKIAKIISGASPAFILGYAKGLLKGIWEGITDPFVLAYQLIKGVGEIFAWLEQTAKSALSGSDAGQAIKSVAKEPPKAAPDPNKEAVRACMQNMAEELAPPVKDLTKGFMPAVREVFSSDSGMGFSELMDKLGEAWDAVLAAIKNQGSRLAKEIIDFLLKDASEKVMGESIGWLTGTIVFEVVLAILTAGTATAAKGAMKVVKVIVKILDWTGEAMGAVFKGLAKIGGFVLDCVKGLVRLFKKAGGKVKQVLSALADIGEKIVKYAEELLGLAGKRGAGEAAETAAEQAGKKTGKKLAAETTTLGTEQTAGKAARAATPSTMAGTTKGGAPPPAKATEPPLTGTRYVEPDSPEYHRLQHEAWSESMQRGGMEPGPIKGFSKPKGAVKPGTYLDDIKTPQDAYKAYNEALSQAKGREVGIYRNIDNGTYSVRVGSELSVGAPYKGNWESVLHYHPNPENVLNYRMPAPADIEGTVLAAFRSNRSITEFVEYPVPGIGRGRVTYTATPGNPPKISLEYMRPDGTRIKREFSSLEEYQKAWGARTSYLEPGSPEYKWIMQDLEDFYRKDPFSSPSASMTMAGTAKPGKVLRGGVKPHPADPNIAGKARGRYQAGLGHEGLLRAPKGAVDIHHMWPQALLDPLHPQHYLVKGMDIDSPLRTRGITHGYKKPGSLKVTTPLGQVKRVNVHSEIGLEINEFLKTNPDRLEFSKFVDYMDWRWGHLFWENFQRAVR